MSALVGGSLARAVAISALVFATAQPARAQQEATLEYKATVSAAREAEVAPRLDGLLTAIHFSAGKVVKKGDLLFEFGARNAELSLALAQAHLKQAEAQLRLSEVNLRNKRTLRERNSVSEMQFLDAEAQRDIAAGKVDEARANVDISQIVLEQMKLYAPITGIISRPLVREGTYITKEARGQSHLATIVQLDPIHVVGQVHMAAYFQRSSENGGALKTLEQTADQREFELVLPTGGNYPHKGRLVAGAYEFDRATQTAEVVVEFPNPDYLLRPGLSVSLRSLKRP